MDGCSNCLHGRHSKSGMVACAVAYIAQDPLAWIEYAVPKDQPVYQGWGMMHRYYGDETGDGSATSGLITNDVFLMEPDCCCLAYENRRT